MARRLGSRNRREEQAIQLRLLDRLEAQHERQFRRELSGTYREMADWFEAGNSLDLYNIQSHRERVGQTLVSTWERSATTFGQRILGAAGKAHGRHAIQTKEMPDAFMQGLMAFQRIWLAQKITQVSSTTMAQAAAVIKRGEEEGLGVEPIAAMLRERASAFAGVRAHVIARTETHAGQGWGNQSAAEASGLDLEKEWISASDERTRTDHADADGQEVGMKEMFVVGGSELMYPGDMSGPAEQVIMCRCVSGYIAE